EVADDAVAEPLGVGLDDPPDDVQRPPGLHRADPSHHRLVGPLDQQPGVLGHVPGQEGGVRVPVHAADIGGYVNVDDVAVADHGVVGDAVADDLVERGAERLRVAPVAQGGRVRPVGDQEIVPDLVQVVGGDPGPHV